MLRKLTSCYRREDRSRVFTVCVIIVSVVRVGRERRKKENTLLVGLETSEASSDKHQSMLREKWTEQGRNESKTMASNGCCYTPPTFANIPLFVVVLLSLRFPLI